jgi:hypothetical protein
MTKAIRQTITVQQGGRIEIRSPELHPGETAEVIVLVNGADSAGDKLAKLEELQRAMSLSHEAAESWIQQANEERHSDRRRIGPHAGYRS